MKRALVLFDGDCGICGHSRRILQKLDWLGHFECRAYQEPGLLANYPSLSTEDCQKEIKLIMPSGQITGGADALIQICLGLPLMAPAGALFWLPPFRQIMRLIYPYIAKNRYRISSTCGLNR